MKALEIPESAQHIVLLEKGDRFVQLINDEAAVVISENDDKEIQVTVHYPNLEEGQEVPLHVVLTACVREFLYDTEMVKTIQDRLRQKQNKSEDK